MCGTIRFELAIPATDTTLSVLPHAPLRRADKWILKMHGCVTRVDDIVLTRTDYSQCVPCSCYRVVNAQSARRNREVVPCSCLDSFLVP